MKSRVAGGRRRLGGEGGGVEFLILLEGGLCVFQLPLGNPGVFFG